MNEERGFNGVFRNTMYVAIVLPNALAVVMMLLLVGSPSQMLPISYRNVSRSSNHYASCHREILSDTALGAQLP